MQLNYLFGNLNYNQNVLFSSIPAVYDSYLNDKVHIRGWKPSVGFLYRKIINQKEVEKDNSVRKKMFSAGLVINCLLYTSDAADERSSVDLGGRRIIKKKKAQRHGG